MIDRELIFEPAAYSLDALQRAAYRMSDRLSVDLRSEESAIRCELHISTDDAAIADTAVGEFRNHALDESLRERIRTETADVRNLILALAFSETGLTSDAASDLGSVEDGA
jgi:His-Xaa-Ser system protein HxsD